MEDPVVADALLDSGVLDLVDIIRCYGLNSDWRAKISERGFCLATASLCAELSLGGANKAAEISLRLSKIMADTGVPRLAPIDQARRFLEKHRLGVRIGGSEAAWWLQRCSREPRGSFLAGGAGRMMWTCGGSDLEPMPDLGSPRRLPGPHGLDLENECRDQDDMAAKSPNDKESDFHMCTGTALLGDVVSCVSVGGNALITAGGDPGTLCLFDISSGAPTLRASYRSPCWQVSDETKTVCRSAGGTYAAAGDVDGCITVWILGPTCLLPHLSSLHGSESKAPTAANQASQPPPSEGGHDSSDDAAGCKAHATPSSTAADSSASQAQGSRQLYRGRGRGWKRRLHAPAQDVNCVAFSPDCKMIASCSDDMTVGVWGVEDGDLLAQLRGHVDAVESVAFSHDGLRLASGSHDDTCILWRVAGWERISGRPGSATSMPHSGSVWSVAFDPRGTWLASGSSDTSIKLWCAQTGRQRHVLTGAHSKFVLSVAFDPAGELLASGGWDKKVLLWRLRGRDTAPQVYRELRGHTGYVWSLSFGLGVLVTGGHDRMVKVWDVAMPPEGDDDRDTPGHP